VNLIGEHTDYNGLPVLPIAVDRDVLVAARARPDAEVDLINTDVAFAPRRFRLDSAIAPFPAGDWGNYPKAAAQALMTELQRRGARPLPGAHLCVDGRIPAAAGLASSSALVVAVGLAHLALAGVDFERLELAELLASAERYVGTLSGGMDQAVALLGRARHAIRIDFFPLRTRPVPVPAGAVFVVAHSLERAEKSGAARGLYNQRVVECALACALLARRTGVPATRLAELPDPAALLSELATLLPDAVTRAALPGLLGLSADDVERRFLAGITLADSGRFVLRARVRHVLSEAARVTAAEEALRRGDLPALGGLMDASHLSCAGDYEASTAALDQLVAAAHAGAALGARLTGAGFGGAIVALVPRDGVRLLLAALDREFYASRGGSPKVRLVVQPDEGASFVRVPS
jgi:galactokinase